MMLMVSGCMIGPNYIRPPAQVAEQWMEVSDAQLKPEPADNVEWWQVFNDPILNQLVEMAYAQNLPLQQAGLRILQTRAQLGIRVGEFYPQVQDGTGSYTRSHISTNVAGLQVAEQWMEVSDAQLKPEPADNVEWWQVFNDPILNQLVEMAYAQNLPLQQAGLRILQTRAQLGIRVGEFYPQIQDATGSYTRTHISTNVAGLNDLSRLPFIDLDRGTDTFQSGFDAAWELDFWGKFRRSIESANAEVLASIANYDDVLVTLADGYSWDLSYSHSP